MPSNWRLSTTCSGIHPAYITPTGGNYPPSLSFAEYGPTSFTPFDLHAVHAAQAPRRPPR